LKKLWSQLITEVKIKEGKIRQNLHSSLTDALQETSSEQLGLSSSKLYNNVESSNINEEQRETSKQTFHLDMAESTLKYSGLKSLHKCSPRYAIRKKG